MLDLFVSLSQQEAVPPARGQAAWLPLNLSPSPEALFGVWAEPPGEQLGPTSCC